MGRRKGDQARHRGRPGLGPGVRRRPPSGERRSQGKGRTAPPARGPLPRTSPRTSRGLSRHPEVVEWWEGRGFDEGLREKFLLGVAGAGDAATIPFWNGGRVHGIVRRKLRGEPKY